ncbi:MAG: HAD hydrolase-like protein [Candidatus Nanoarchaeia archaeon]
MKPFWIAQNPIVTLDFDGCLGDPFVPKLKLIKDWFGVNATPEQTRKSGFLALMKQLGSKENYDTFMTRLNEELIMEFEVQPYCLEMLKKLHTEGYRFAVITSREDESKKAMERFLAKHYKGIIDYAHHTNELSSGKSKAGFVAKLKSRIHLDDDLYKLEAIAGLPVELFYLRNRGNAHMPLPANYKGRVIEIKDWRQFYQEIIRIKLMHEAICKANEWENKWSNVSKIFKFWKEDEQRAEQLIKQYTKEAA